MSRLNFTGKTIGKLTVLKKKGVITIGSRPVSLWLCRCVCGKVVSGNTAQLRKSKDPSCSSCAPKKGRPLKPRTNP